MRRVLAVAMALAGTAACSYIFELPASDSIPSLDSGLADADPDAPGDAGVDADAEPPPRYCATAPSPFVYCADFDDVPTPDLATFGTAQVAGGQFALSSAVALSPPRSLLASIVRGVNASAGLVRSLEADPDGLTLAFDMLVSAWTTADARLARIELGDAATNQCVVQLSGNDTTWLVTQTCTSGGVETATETTPSTSGIVRGRWQRFALTVRFAPTPAVSLAVDGASVLDAAGIAPLTRAPAAIGLGIQLVPDGSVTAFQDNVLVTSP